MFVQYSVIESELIWIMYQKPSYKSGPNPALCKYNTIKVIDIEWFIGYNGFQYFRRIIESKWFSGIYTSKNELYMWK